MGVGVGCECVWVWVGMNYGRLCEVGTRGGSKEAMTSCGAANITCRLTKMLRTLERSLKP